MPGRARGHRALFVCAREKRGAVGTQVIVVNRGARSGSSGIVRCLPANLPDHWLRIGVDDFIEALPPSLADSDAAGQAEIVPKGVRYDVEVDTSHTEAMDRARAIAAHLVVGSSQDSNSGAR